MDGRPSGRLSELDMVLSFSAGIPLLEPGNSTGSEPIQERRSMTGRWTDWTGLSVDLEQSRRNCPTD